MSETTPPLGSLDSAVGLTGQQIYDILGAMTPEERALEVRQYEKYEVTECRIGTFYELPCIYIT